MTFSDQVMTLNGTYVNFSSFDKSWQKEHDGGKMNGVSLLSQELLSKKLVSYKNGYFLVGALWSLSHWPFVKFKNTSVKEREKSCRMRFSAAL